MQIGTQTKALNEKNWFASTVFLANEKWHFDNQFSQKHVKMPQILQNANGTQTKAHDERNWFASRVFLANEKRHFDNQILSQKHVKMPQILQNAIGVCRYLVFGRGLKVIACISG